MVLLKPDGTPMLRSGEAGGVLELIGLPLQPPQELKSHFSQHKVLGCWGSARRARNTARRWLRLIASLEQAPNSMWQANVKSFMTRQCKSGKLHIRSEEVAGFLERTSSPLA